MYLFLYYFACDWRLAESWTGIRQNAQKRGRGRGRRGAPLTQKLSVSQNTSNVPLSTMAADMDHLPDALPARPSTTTAITPDTPAARALSTRALHCTVYQACAHA